VNYDELVRPIEEAATPAEARSAMWAVMREVKRMSLDDSAG
jgi:hypothetical protein